MLLVDLDIIEYSRATELQRQVVDRKLSTGFPDVLFMLQHPSTVTLGFRAQTSDLLIPEDDLAALGVALHRSDRGGLATYHGPGQLVVYPVMDLKARGLSARRYVRGLEEAILNALRDFGVIGLKKEREIGIWADAQRKIASIGVRVRRGIAYHGFSLNVELQDDPSRFVICCGMPDARMVSLNDLLRQPVPLASVREAVRRAFSEAFHLDLEPGSLQVLEASLEFGAERDAQ